MAEISYNPDVEQIIRGNLAATKRWEWVEDDRKWAAIGAALKYFRGHSTMSEVLALGLAEKITTEIMGEETRAARLQAEEHQEDEEEDEEESEGDGSGLHQCPYCYNLVIEGHEEFCALSPYRNRNIVP